MHMVDIHINVRGEWRRVADGVSCTSLWWRLMNHHCCRPYCTAWHTHCRTCKHTNKLASCS